MGAAAILVGSGAIVYVVHGVAKMIDRGRVKR